MFVCPKCDVQLLRTQGPYGVFWRCPTCDGRSATVSLLRKSAPPEAVNSLWQTARSAGLSRSRRCPACNRPMTEVPARTEHGTEHLDVCTLCQFVWFDTGEYEALPSVPSPVTPEDTLPQAAREKLALLEIEAIREEAQDSEATPDAWWQWIPGVLGMPIERDEQAARSVPWMTWLITLLISVVSLTAFFDPRNAIENFGLVPAQFGRYAGLTFLTSFFVHGGILHLLGNMYFLLVFGDNVEDWLGRGRFLLLLACSVIVGNIAHVLGDPRSAVPCIGASGGISGIIAFYALRFPQVKLGFMLRILVWFRWVPMPAYAMFAIWVALQIFGAWAQVAGFGNVSYLAHLGGASIGLVFWFATRNR